MNKRVDDLMVHTSNIMAGSAKKIRKPKPWKLPQVITKSQLMQMREEFWDTAPHYGGRTGIHSYFTNSYYHNLYYYRSSNHVWLSILMATKAKIRQ